MRRIISAFPPRYGELLWLTLSMLPLRVLPWLPYFAAYFLPLGVWSKLLAVFCPMLFYTVVCPLRIRYGAMLGHLAKDPGAPISARTLLARSAPWKNVLWGRVQMVLPKALPFWGLLVFTLMPLMLMNVFAGLDLVLRVYTWIASFLETTAAFIPRMLMGESPVAQAGVLGGALTMAGLLLLAFCLFAWSMFQTSAYRFGYTRLPRFYDIKPLLRQNLRLWLPTAALAIVFVILSYSEIMLTLSNILSIAPLYAVKWRLPQIAAAALMVISYVALLPVRKMNTANWVQNRGKS